jgi:ankyrin repeat protein
MMLPKSKLTKLVGLIAIPLVILQLTCCAHMTPLTAAAKEGDVATIKELLNKGAKIDEPNSGKWSATPLYWSLFDCKFEAAELLLKKGANANSADSFGLASLHLAVCCKDVDLSLIEHFIEKGADVNFKNTSDGWRGLHYAISCGSDDVARLLIEKGANVNGLADDGTSPLILAAKNDSVFIAKLLLERGADVDWRDFHKKNAMSYAKGVLGIFKKKKKMMQLLESAGGK